MAIVTVFSGSYCDGEGIAELVARRLEYERIDQTLLEETSRRFSIPSDKFVRTMTGAVPVLNKLTHEREKNTACLRLVAADLASRDTLVLHGFAAHLIARGIAHVLRVCVIGNFDYRVKRVMEIEGKSEKDAHKIIHKDVLL